MTELDLTFVRAQFPAFSEPSLKDWAFFENAGGSYPARHTIERLTEFYTRLKMQPYAPNPASTEAGRGWTTRTGAWPNGCASRRRR